MTGATRNGVADLYAVDGDSLTTVLKVTRLCPWKSWDRLLKNKEKVEKHIKVVIFISKTSWVQRRWKNTLKLRFLSQKLHGFRFRRWKKTPKLPFFTPKSFHFYLIFMSKEKVEGDTKAAIFNSKNLQFLFDFYLKQDSFLCFSIYKFIFFIFRLSFVFVLVPFLFMSLHVDCIS
ncbi:hypothetical protein GmHk_20G056857 [Glycine max]|nr:hypothetical protein GmHk_20G056857 [Glycine max]